MKSRDSSVEQRQRQTLRVFGRFIYNVLQKRSDFEYVVFFIWTTHLRVFFMDFLWMRVNVAWDCGLQQSMGGVTVFISVSSEMSAPV